MHGYMESAPDCWAAFGSVLAREYSDRRLLAWSPHPEVVRGPAVGRRVATVTPAVTALKRESVAYEVRRYDVPKSDERTYGELVAEAIGMPPERVFKTLVAELDGGELVVAVVPVSRSLDLRALATAANAKSASMATPAKAERATGYVTGGISPFGQRRRLRTFVDVTARRWESVCVSAGRRGLQLEIAPSDLVAQTSAVETPLSR